jgi:hypothetical protein
MDLESPLPELLQADAITLCLDNQKNGQRMAQMYHTKSNDPELCPVIAGAHLIDEIRGMPQSTPLGTIRNGNKASRIQAAEMRAAIRTAAVEDGLEAQGYDLRRIGSHSLRAGGAVRLKLLGEDEDVIKRLGRWSSNTYLKYIQPQIGQLTAGIAERMAKGLRFHHVGV